MSDPKVDLNMFSAEHGSRFADELSQEQRRASARKDDGKLYPGKLGGIAEFAAECDLWGFDARTEGPKCCNDQFSMDWAVKVGIDMGMLSAHSASFYAGWWHDKESGAVTDQAYMVPIKLMLIVSEVAEAMEGDRKNLMDDKLPHRRAVEVELADVWIRLMDLAGAMDLDLGGAVVEKMAYNLNRADHKEDARKAENGKGY